MRQVCAQERPGERETLSLALRLEKHTNDEGTASKNGWVCLRPRQAIRICQLLWLLNHGHFLPGAGPEKHGALKNASWQVDVELSSSPANPLPIWRIVSYQNGISMKSYRIQKDLQLLWRVREKPDSRSSNPAPTTLEVSNVNSEGRTNNARLCRHISSPHPAGDAMPNFDSLSIRHGQTELYNVRQLLSELREGHNRFCLKPLGLEIVRIVQPYEARELR
jgi:hypothetical protein